MGIVEEHPLVRSLEPSHLDFELWVVDALRLPKKHGSTIQQSSVLPQFEMVEQRGSVFRINAFIKSPDQHRLSRRIPNDIQVKVVKRQFWIRLILPFAPEATPREEHPLVLFLAHYSRGGLNSLVRFSVVDVGLAISTIDMAHNGRVRLIHRNIRDLDVRRRLELLEHLEKVALCRI